MSARPVRRWRLALAFVVLTAATCEGKCELTQPLGLSLGPGPFTPTYPPGSFFFFTSQERAVELGDTLVITVLDASGAVWTVSDTTVATASGVATGAVLRPRRTGFVNVAGLAHGVTITRLIEVVTTLCRRTTVTTPITTVTDTIFDLGDDDCRLGYHGDFPEWPEDARGPTFPTLRAEGRRLVLTDSTFVRVDAASDVVFPLLALIDSTNGWTITMRRNPWGRAFIASLLPPGVYTLWIAGEPDRPTSAIHLTARQVPLCTDSTTAIGTMTLGVEVEGSLDATDCHADGGWAQEWWRITLPSDGWYRVSMQPTSAYWRGPAVFNRDGFVSDLPTFRLAGTYTFHASGLSDMSYRLRVVSCASATVCP